MGRNTKYAAIHQFGTPRTSLQARDSALPQRGRSHAVRRPQTQECH
ncbi:hypothetical protein ACN9MJ_01220 [Acidovorax facilis]